ncbi:hypothetical protein HOY80DRAFT_1058153 [Tuber brumale]|nr:hypothetical protein HOY80DRAFT_1058153 [Tuber brumale]
MSSTSTINVDTSPRRAQVQANSFVKDDVTDINMDSNDLTKESPWPARNGLTPAFSS